MQTKLSVALAATLAGFALSAQAANVEVYGLIDTGLNYQHVDADRAGVDDVSKFQMKSSQSTPNRVGLRGTEDLGQGLKVGFVLESQFNSDDGSLMPGNRLFHRAAQIMLMSDDYGTLVLGRSGMLRSGFGTTGIWGGKVSPFSNSWGDYMVGSKYIMPGGFKPGDNTITYQSPVMSGLQLHAQYSNQLDAPAPTTGKKKARTAPTVSGPWAPPTRAAPCTSPRCSTPFSTAAPTRPPAFLSTIRKTPSPSASPRPTTSAS